MSIGPAVALAWRESRCLLLPQVVRVGEVAAVAADGARIDGQARGDVTQ